MRSPAMLSGRAYPGFLGAPGERAGLPARAAWQDRRRARPPPYPVVGAPVRHGRAGPADRRLDRRGLAAAGRLRPGPPHDQCAGRARRRRPLGDDHGAGGARPLPRDDRPCGTPSGEPRAGSCWPSEAWPRCWWRRSRSRARTVPRRRTPSAAGTAFVALAAWPLLAGRTGSDPVLSPPVSVAAGVVLMALVAWFFAELVADSGRVGLSERVAAGAQALWPAAVAWGTAGVTSRRSDR